MQLILVISTIVMPVLMVASDFYSVKNEVQIARTNLVREKCQIIEEEEKMNGTKISGCSTTFDSIMCWKSIRNDSPIIQMCPDYFNGFKINGEVKKYCDKFGIWSKTDYSGCVPSEMWSYISSNSTMNKIEVVENLGSVGYGISILSLIIAIGIMLKFRYSVFDESLHNFIHLVDYKQHIIIIGSLFIDLLKLHCTRNTIHVHLFVSFLLRGCFHFLQLTYHLQDLNIWLCKFLVVLENFLIEASYTWVFIEALYLHNTIFVHVLSESRARLWMYISIGWGLPCLVIGILIGARYIFEDTGCWIIDNLNISRWIMISYPTITILCNVFFFFHITREIFIKIRQEPSHERHRYRRLTKSTFILVLVFGLYHLIFIPVELFDTRDKTRSLSILDMVRLYYTHIFVTFQGFIVAILFCFLNGEVINELKRNFRHSSNMYASRTIDCKYSPSGQHFDQSRQLLPRKNNNQYLLHPTNRNTEINNQTMPSAISTEFEST